MRKCNATYMYNIRKQQIRYRLFMYQFKNKCEIREKNRKT